MRLPVLFSAHGSPMNALGGTDFAAFLAAWGRQLPRLQAVAVISAHWESDRLAATTSPQPGTIHDFFGFPAELYALRYPAPGTPSQAARAAALLRAAGLPVDEDPLRGLDHGAWSPLLHLMPAADVPVFQISLLQGVPFSRHLEVGKALRPLRDEGVLLLGSGNVVHNLVTADLARRDRPVEPWAREFDAWVRDRLDRSDLDALADPSLAPHGRKAHPTPEHYLPLLVACGAAGEGARVEHAFEGFEHGTLSMRSVRFD